VRDRPEIFVTPRLVASRWDPARDAEAAYAIYSDPEVVRFIGNRPATSVEDQRERLMQVLERDVALGAPFGGFPLFTREGWTLVGTALIQPLRDAERRWLEGEIEIGWHLGRAFWGRGYATETGRALIAYGFAELDVDALHAVVDPGNPRSCAVAKRIGMSHVGTTDRYYGDELEHFVIGRSDASA
jgi:RimJ/RimL family protein N-acetyltransferase